MKNADMPAMPLVDSGFGQYKPEVFAGLAKREELAARAMQAILANLASEEIGYTDWASNIAKHAITAADALLAELDK